MSEEAYVNPVAKKYFAMTEAQVRNNILTGSAAQAAANRFAEVLEKVSAAKVKAAEYYSRARWFNRFDVGPDNVDGEEATVRMPANYVPALDAQANTRCGRGGAGETPAITRKELARYHDNQRRIERSKLSAVDKNRLLDESSVALGNGEYQGLVGGALSRYATNRRVRKLEKELQPKVPSKYWTGVKTAAKNAYDKTQEWANDVNEWSMERYKTKAATKVDMPKRNWKESWGEFKEDTKRDFSVYGAALKADFKDAGHNLSNAYDAAKSKLGDANIAIKDKTGKARIAMKGFFMENMPETYESARRFKNKVANKINGGDEKLYKVFVDGGAGYLWVTEDQLDKVGRTQ